MRYLDPNRRYPLKLVLEPDMVYFVDDNRSAITSRVLRVMFRNGTMLEMSKEEITLIRRALEQEEDAMT
jgi:nicotinamide riboside kinase